MKNEIVKRSQKSIPSLRRENSSYSEDVLKASSIARVSENSERRTLLVSKNKSYSRSLTKNCAKMPYENFVR